MEAYKKNKEVINYIMVGILTTLVSLAVYYALVLTILNPEDALLLQVANIISWIASVTFAYFANRKFVFESKNEHIVLEAMKFYISRLSTLVIDMAIMFIGVSGLSFNDKIVKIIVQIVVITTNYFLSKLFVFGKSKD